MRKKLEIGKATEDGKVLTAERAKEIEQVGKATMVDLRAQLYRSEESLKHTESGASAAWSHRPTGTPGPSRSRARTFAW